MHHHPITLSLLVACSLLLLMSGIYILSARRDRRRTDIANGWSRLFLSKLKVGTMIQVDNGFTCVKAWSIVEVKHDPQEAYKNKDHASGFYFDCAKGKHWLTAQVNDDKDDRLVGIRDARYIAVRGQ